MARAAQAMRASTISLSGSPPWASDAIRFSATLATLGLLRPPRGPLGPPCTTRQPARRGQLPERFVRVRPSPRLVRDPPLQRPAGNAASPDARITGGTPAILRKFGKKPRACRSEEPEGDGGGCWSVLNVAGSPGGDRPGRRAGSDSQSSKEALVCRPGIPGCERGG